MQLEDIKVHFELINSCSSYSVTINLVIIRKYLIITFI